MNYFDNKYHELEILNGYLEDKVEIKCYSLLEILEAKLEIAKQLKLQNFSKYYCELINKDEIKFKGDFDYSYSYSRIDGFISIPNFAQNFYGVKNCYNNTIFSNCGMSSIVALLTSMICYNDVKIDVLYEGTYSETVEYIETISQNKKYSNLALYVDTSAIEFPSNLDAEFINKYDYVIIDTTCYLGGDLFAFIECLNDLNKPCFLLRSHTKLDMLGTEFSGMGSIALIDKIKRQESAKIFENAKHLLSIYGASLTPDKFPVFILNEELTNLNKVRVGKIRENTKFMLQAMTDAGIEWQKPEHELFLIKTFKNKLLTLQEIKNKISIFCKNHNELLIFNTISYGFDFVTFDCSASGDCFKLRICLNDMPKSKLLLLVNDLIEFLKRELCL